MRGRVILALVAAGLVSGPTFAQTKASKNFDPKRIVCKKQQPQPGSRIGAGRICATALEWQQRDEMSAETRRNIDKIQQQRAH